MLKFYKIIYRFIFTDYSSTKTIPYISNIERTVLMDEENFQNEMVKYTLPKLINWKNIEVIMHGMRWISFKFPFYYFANGIVCVPDKDAWEYKETTLTLEEDPCMRIICTTNVSETKLTINEILNWPDGDKAIQYLVERGMKI